MTRDMPTVVGPCNYEHSLFCKIIVDKNDEISLYSCLLSLYVYDRCFNPFPADNFSKYKMNVIPNKECI